MYTRIINMRYKYVQNKEKVSKNWMEGEWREEKGDIKWN